MQKYPHLRNEEDRVMEDYKVRQDYDSYSVPSRLARRPKLRAHQTLWNEEEFMEQGKLDDPNSADYERLQQEKTLRMRRMKRNK